LVVAPEVLGDFRKLPFADERFCMVVFDPPHLLAAGDGWQRKKYGSLSAGWQGLLRDGFAECFRVLKTNGTLVFKWCAEDIPVSHMLTLTPYQPVVGQRCGRQSKTHWLVFLK
jgi:SAM-dependent methyltransferase